MPRVIWPLVRGRPAVQVLLLPTGTGASLQRQLLADTGAASSGAGFEIMLDHTDCLACGGIQATAITLGGAYVGAFPVYFVRVQIPAVGFDRVIRAAGVSYVPQGFDGIAAFPFLNRFTYGNFGDSGQFGLEN